MKSLGNLKSVGIFWSIVTTATLIFILKPYNKSKQTFKKPDYEWYTNSTDSLGYSVDYDGTIDIVSYGNPFYSEIQGKNGRYELRLNLNYKKGEHPALFKYYLNGYLADSIWLKPKESQIMETILRRNDYLKLEFSPSHGHAELGVTMQKGMQERQMELYLFILIWFASSLVLVYWKQWVHALLPSVPFLLAVYAEHLYTNVYDVWVLLGFVLVVLGLSGIGSYLKFALSKFSRWVYLIWDFIVLSLAFFCAMYVAHFKIFGFRMDYDSIVAILQSNPSEMMEFVFINLAIWKVVLLVLVVLLPFGTSYLQAHKKKEDVIWWPMACLLLLVGLNISIESRFVNEWVHARARYNEELEKFNIVQNRFKNASNIPAKKEETKETYVIVIGESQSKEHMSLYGYHKNTTPRLDSLKRQGELVVLDSAYSCHTHTVLVLQNALTKANQYNDLDYTSVPSLINVLNAADFETVWISNQVKLSSWDNIVSAIAASCDKEYFVNKNIGETIDDSPHDEAILPRLESYLSSNTTKNRVVFVHLMGNHGKYNYRYPASAKKLPTLNDAEYGKQSTIENWAYYDNSILYNDSIVNEIIEVLKKAPGETKCLSYFADHGEDLREGRGHNSGQYTPRMVQIPAFFWWDSSYQMRYPNSCQQLTENQNQLWSNDLFYDAFLDLSHVKTTEKSKEFSILQDGFVLNNPKVKNGSKSYFDEGNPFPFLPSNVKKSNGFNARIGAHRCNSIAKAYQAISKGVSCVELDVVIREDGMLEVGHGEVGTMTGLDLKNFLNHLPINDSLRIWLDVKNLASYNLELLHKKLDELNKKYRVKGNWIIESSSTLKEFAQLAAAGYHTSYYLPTSILSEPVSRHPEIANRIAQQIISQQVQAISFDHGLHAFVQKYLKPRTTVRIFHTWDLSIDLGNKRWGPLVQDKEYMRTPSVQTVLFPFPSANNL